MSLLTLYPDSKGKSVSYCQERLNIKGYHVSVTGDFDAPTVAAVKQFQSAQGLVVDGIVGSRTWAALKVDTVAPIPPDVADEGRNSLFNKIPAGLNGVVESVLKTACADLGKKETPDGSNTGPEIIHLVGGYNQYWWNIKSGTVSAAKSRGYVLESECNPPPAWCGMAVASWIRIGMGLPDWNLKGYAKPLAGHPFEKFLGGAAQIEDWAKDRGTWKAGGAGSARIPSGALFTTSREGSGSDASASAHAGHIGMVVCDNNDGTVTTIEGNVSNSVGTHTRKKSDIRGWTTWW